MKKKTAKKTKKSFDTDTPELCYAHATLLRNLIPLFLALSVVDIRESHYDEDYESIWARIAFDMGEELTKPDQRDCLKRAEKILDLIRNDYE